MCVCVCVCAGRKFYWLSTNAFCPDALRQIEQFADEEEELLSLMQDPDGSEGLGLELGEEDLLFPGHRNVSLQPVAPAVDRLDPTVPHSEEFDYTFQEMMQAAADEVNSEAAAIRQRHGTTFSSPENLLEKAHNAPVTKPCMHLVRIVCNLMPVPCWCLLRFLWAVSLFERRYCLPNGLRGD